MTKESNDDPNMLDGDTFPVDCENGTVCDTAIEDTKASRRFGRCNRMALICGIFCSVIVSTLAIAVTLTKSNNAPGVSRELSDLEVIGHDNLSLVYDVVVYGDSSAAVIAAVSAKRQGRSVVLVNPTHFLGGMSASGDPDFGSLESQEYIGGIAAEFYSLVANAYNTSFVENFEPHVAQETFEKLIVDANVTAFLNEQLNREDGVEMNGPRIVSITTLSGKTFKGKMFIDTTYVGDLMASAGVSYTVGRESHDEYGESLAGMHRCDIEPRPFKTAHGDQDHSSLDMDPFVVEGDADSGLLPNVNDVLPINGQGDDKIQPYNYPLLLTSDPSPRAPIAKPEGYREMDYELMLRNVQVGNVGFSTLFQQVSGTSEVEWKSIYIVGTDYVGASYEYPEASYERRLEIEEAHKTFAQGQLWTLTNSGRVPKELRDHIAKYGLSKDEFVDNGHWPYMMNIRARRMVSDYVMTQNNIEGNVKSLPDPVALVKFGVESHAVQYFVDETGHVQCEGEISISPPSVPYQVSYRSIVPKRIECENLYSPVCLSCSHVAQSSLRMEPVIMVLAERAAIAASIAIDMNVAVQDVDYSILRSHLDTNEEQVAVLELDWSFLL